MYIQGRYLFVCRTKQGRKTHALWCISRYHRMCNIISEVSHKLRSLKRSSTVLLKHIPQILLP